MKVPQHQSEKYSNGWIRAGLGFGFIAFVFWKLDVAMPGEFDIKKLIWAAIAIQPLAMLALLLHATRLGLLAGLSAKNIRRPLSALLLSQGFNLVLPGRVAELFKATYLRAYADVPLSQGLAAVVLERSVDMLIVAALGLVGVALMSSAGSGLTFGLAGLVIVTLVLVPLLENRLAALAKRLPWPRLRAFSESLLKHVAQTVRAGTFYSGLVLGLATWAVSFANIYVFIHIAGSKPVGIEGVLVLFVATTIGGAVPALPGGFGGYEAAAVLALKSYGYGLEEALPLAIGMHLAQFVLPVLGGAVILTRERVGISALLRHLRKRPEGSNGETR